MKSLVTAFACLLIGSTLDAQLTTTPFKEATLPLEGCTYVLPKTVLTATVTYKQQVQTPGPYAQYAERFLGLTTVIQNEQTTHELVSVTLTSTAVPDETAWFHVKLADSKHPMVVNLSPEGFLLGCNVPITALPSNNEHPVSALNQTNEGSTQTRPESVLTRDMQQATSTAKLAELAAAQIFTIRESRMSLLQQETDHTPADGRAFALVLEELNRMETYYMELFSGKKTSSTLVKQIEFEPKQEEEVVLFRFNQQNGMVDKNDLSGSPVSIKLTKMPIPDRSILKNRVEKKPTLSGIYYRIPCPTVITVFDAHQTYAQTTLSIPQFGSINSLPVDMTRTFRLCPLTGSLLEAGR